MSTEGEAMTQDEQRWLLKALYEAADAIERLVVDLDDEELRRRPDDDTWSLKETLLHLRDAEALYLRWLEAMVERDGADLPNVDIEDYPAERGYQSADLYEALTEFARLRSHTAYLLRSLSRGEWKRAGRHVIRGPVTVEQLAREMNQHDLEHLWQMRRLLGLVARHS